MTQKDKDDRERQFQVRRTNIERIAKINIHRIGRRGRETTGYQIRRLKLKGNEMTDA